jgi:DNA repair protein RadC
MDYAKLSDLELLRMVIGTREAERLYGGKLAPLFVNAASGRRPHQRLAVAHELVKRFLFEELRRDQVFANPAAVKSFLLALFAGKEHESFVVLFLDNQHRLIAAEELSRGTIDGAAVYPREVVKATLRHNAAAVVISHNHPSGLAEPSAADRALTTKLKEALATVDVRVLDHLVVGGATATSFAERGWL